MVTRILLVEDNADNREMLTRRLQRRGYEVLCAEDGGAAIQMALAEQPDLVLMDLDLPVVDGWEATRRIRLDPAGAALAILALSAHAMTGAREKAIAAGCDDYDSKPVEFSRLMEKVDALLSRRSAAAGR